MFKKRNLIFLCLLILGVLLIAGCSPNPPITIITVTFDSQGGSAVDSQIVSDDEKVTKPTTPTKEGYNFGGWYKESECTNVWDFDTDTVTSDVTLFAKWTPLYALRDTGPAGGWIFYVKESGYSDGWMYLEAAPNDQSSRAWGTSNHTVPGADGIEIGTGQQNTLDIIGGDVLSDKAADECANYSIVNGGVTYDDWFLPSKNELNQMYMNLKANGVGGFDIHDYWSSSETDAWYAWSQGFYYGSQNYNSKFQPYRVRAVRAF